MSELYFVQQQGTDQGTDVVLAADATLTSLGVPLDQTDEEALHHALIPAEKELADFLVATAHPVRYKRPGSASVVPIKRSEEYEFDEENEGTKTSMSPLIRHRLFAAAKTANAAAKTANAAGKKAERQAERQGKPPLPVSPLPLQNPPSLLLPSAHSAPSTARSGDASTSRSEKEKGAASALEQRKQAREAAVKAEVQRLLLVPSYQQLSMSTLDGSIAGPEASMLSLHHRHHHHHHHHLAPPGTAPAIVQAENARRIRNYAVEKQRREDNEKALFGGAIKARLESAKKRLQAEEAEREEERRLQREEAEAALKAAMEEVARHEHRHSGSFDFSALDHHHHHQHQHPRESHSALPSQRSTIKVNEADFAPQAPATLASATELASPLQVPAANPHARPSLPRHHFLFPPPGGSAADRKRLKGGEFSAVPRTFELGIEGDIPGREGTGGGSSSKAARVILEEMRAIRMENERKAEEKRGGVLLPGAVAGSSQGSIEAGPHAALMFAAADVDPIKVKRAKLWAITIALASRFAFLQRALKAHRAKSFSANFRDALLPLRQKVFEALKRNWRASKLLKSLLSMRLLLTPFIKVWRAQRREKKAAMIARFFKKARAEVPVFAWVVKTILFRIRTLQRFVRKVVLPVSRAQHELIAVQYQTTVVFVRVSALKSKILRVSMAGAEGEGERGSSEGGTGLAVFAPQRSDLAAVVEKLAAKLQGSVEAMKAFVFSSQSPTASSSSSSASGVAMIDPSREVASLNWPNIRSAEERAGLNAVFVPTLGILNENDPLFLRRNQLIANKLLAVVSDAAKASEEAAAKAMLLRRQKKGSGVAFQGFAGVGASAAAPAATLVWAPHLYTGAFSVAEAALEEDETKEKLLAVERSKKSRTSSVGRGKGGLSLSRSLQGDNAETRARRNIDTAWQGLMGQALFTLAVKQKEIDEGRDLRREGQPPPLIAFLLSLEEKKREEATRFGRVPSAGGLRSGTKSATAIFSPTSLTARTPRTARLEPSSSTPSVSAPQPGASVKQDKHTEPDVGGVLAAAERRHEKVERRQQARRRNSVEAAQPPLSLASATTSAAGGAEPAASSLASPLLDRLKAKAAVEKKRKQRGEALPALVSANAPKVAATVSSTLRSRGTEEGGGGLVRSTAEAVERRLKLPAHRRASLTGVLDLGTSALDVKRLISPPASRPIDTRPTAPARVLGSDFTTPTKPSASAEAAALSAPAAFMAPARPVAFKTLRGVVSAGGRRLLGGPLKPERRAEITRFLEFGSADAGEGSADARANKLENENAGSTAFRALPSPHQRQGQTVFFANSGQKLRLRRLSELVARPSETIAELASQSGQPSVLASMTAVYRKTETAPPSFAPSPLQRGFSRSGSFKAANKPAAPARKLSDEVASLQEELLEEFPPVPKSMQDAFVNDGLRAIRRAHIAGIRLYRERLAAWTANFESTVAEASRRLAAATGRHTITADETRVLRQTLKERQPRPPFLVTLLPYPQLEAAVRTAMAQVRGAETAAARFF